LLIPNLLAHINWVCSTLWYWTFTVVCRPNCSSRRIWCRGT